ncbi:MAG: CotH kinase family protein, partial [Treponema sp.]|nr:CotH kinase family protein [Treponema sp.]
MKKKILFLVTGILCLAGLFFSCAADSSGDSGSSGPVKGSVVYNVKSASSTEKIILGWQVPAANYFGVQVSMEPQEGTLASPKKCAADKKNLLVEGLQANTTYSFTFTALDSEGNLGSETTTIQIKTAETTPPDTTPPAEVTNLKLKVTDGIAILTWTDSVSEDVFGYEITYDSKKIEYASRSAFTAMAANTVFVSPGTQEYEFEVDTGKEYSFTIKAVDTSGNKSEGQTLSKKLMDVIEPKPFATRTENLDLIFGTDSVAEITLTIDRTEWNTLLDNYDTNSKNEDCIHADFKMTKAGYTWQAEDIGMRIRGNTSRIRPQQGDKYYQAHFKIDFEEWIEDDTVEEGKLAGCMKGIILKRFKDDPTYVREVFGYNFFRKNGIWTAPRAGYTRLFINIV